MGRDIIRGAASRALALAALAAAGGLVDAGAQVGRAQHNPPPPGRVRSSTLRVELPAPVAETPVPFEEGPTPGRLQTHSFVTPDTTFGREVVAGSPFTADASTEHV